MIFCFAILLYASGCSVRRYLPAGEKLYRGATVKVKKEPEVKGSVHSLKKTISINRPANAQQVFIGATI